MSNPIVPDQQESQGEAIDVSKLKKAVEFARSQGLKSIEIDGIRLELGANELAQVKREVQTDDEVKRAFLDPDSDLTEEEVLFWATPYFDELQETKKARQEALLMESQVKDEVKDGKNNIS